MVIARRIALLGLILALAGCCRSESGALGCIFPLGGDPKRGACDASTAFPPGTDLRPFVDVYFETLRDSTNGPAITAAVEQYRDEALALTDADLELCTRGRALASQWDGHTFLFVEGFGVEAIVSQPMVDDLSGYLDRLEQIGSPGLATAIATERAQLPPLTSLAGLDMNAFRAAVLPLDRVFADGYE